MIRKILLIAAGLAALGVIVWAFLPKPVEADLATVKRGPLRVTVDQEGKTRIRERYVVSAPLAGRLLRIEHKPGHRISAGETVLAAIEPPDPALLDARARAEAEARVEVAQGAQERAKPLLDKAKVTLDFAVKNRVRAAQLRQKDSMSQEEYDEIEHRERTAAEEFRAATFGKLIADYELKLAQAALVRTKPHSTGERDLSRFLIQAPISGQVLRVFQESATVVAAGASLVEVGDPTDLECEIDVLSADAIKIPPNARVLLEHWGGPEPLEGRVRVVEPAAFTKVSALGVEEQRVWVIVDLVDPPKKRPRLGDRYRVEARIVIWEGEDVLQVPAGALFRSGDSWAVYAVVGGKAVVRNVRVGHGNGLTTEILEGIEEGDQVVVHPSDRIADGIAVVPRGR